MNTHCFVTLIAVLVVSSDKNKCKFIIETNITHPCTRATEPTPVVPATFFRGIFFRTQDQEIGIKCHKNDENQRWISKIWQSQVNYFLVLIRWGK